MSLLNQEDYIDERRLNRPLNQVYIINFTASKKFTLER